VARITTDGAVFIMVRTSRHAWPDNFGPFAHHFLTSIRLLRDRLTRREAVRAIRIEGPIREIQDTHSSWEVFGFKGDDGVPIGSKHALDETRNLMYPDPPHPAEGSPSLGSLGLLPGAGEDRIGTLCLF